MISRRKQRRRLLLSRPPCPSSADGNKEKKRRLNLPDDPGTAPRNRHPLSLPTPPVPVPRTHSPPSRTHTGDQHPTNRQNCKVPRPLAGCRGFQLPSPPPPHRPSPQLGSRRGRRWTYRTKWCRRRRRGSPLPPRWRRGPPRPRPPRTPRSRRSLRRRWQPIARRVGGRRQWRACCFRRCPAGRQLLLHSLPLPRRARWERPRQQSLPFHRRQPHQRPCPSHSRPSPLPLPRPHRCRVPPPSHGRVLAVRPRLQGFRSVAAALPHRHRIRRRLWRGVWGRSPCSTTPMLAAVPSSSSSARFGRRGEGGQFVPFVLLKQQRARPLFRPLSLDFRSRLSPPLAGPDFYLPRCIPLEVVALLLLPSRVYSFPLLTPRRFGPRWVQFTIRLWGAAATRFDVVYLQPAPARARTYAHWNAPSPPHSRTYTLPRDGRPAVHAASGGVGGGQENVRGGWVEGGRGERGRGGRLEGDSESCGRSWCGASRWSEEEHTHIHTHADGRARARQGRAAVEPGGRERASVPDPLLPRLTGLSQSTS